MKKYVRLISVIVSLFSLITSVWAQPGQQVNHGAATTPITFPGTCPYNWVCSNPSIGLAAIGTGNTIPAFTAVNTGNSLQTATITATPVKTGFAYIPNYNSASISVVDLASNKVTKTIATDAYPLGVVASADGSRVYVTNAGPNTISVIDAANQVITNKILIGQGGLGGITISADGGHIYVANTSSGNISVINTATNSIDATISVGNSPVGIAVNADGSRIYVANYQSSSVSVIDPAAKSVIKTINVNAGPYGMVITPDGSKVYVTNELDDKVSVINTATNNVDKVIPVGQGPYGITIIPDGSKVYVTSAIDNAIRTINTSTDEASLIIDMGNRLYGLSSNADGSKLYVASAGGNYIVAYDPINPNIEKVIDVGQTPYAIGYFISYGSACGSSAQIYNISVNPAITATPQLIIGEVTGAISACAGTASASPAIQQFTVSASSLAADVTVTAPADFEVSLTAGGGFSNSVTLTQTSGSISSQVVYVRSSAQAAAGNISGNVTLTSGAVTQTAKVAGHVSPLPVINDIADQTKQNGQLTDGIIFSGTARSYTWTNDNTSIGLAASGNQGIGQFTAVNTGTLPVTAHITVNPAPASYAYAANNVANSVSLINTTTNKVEQVITAGIPDHSSPQRLVFSPDKSLLYVANQGSQTVSVISTVTNKVLTTFPAGFDPTGMVISPDGSRLYVTDVSFNQLTIINTATNAIVKTVTTGDYPFDMVISADGKKLYIVNTSANTVQFFDVATNLFEYAIITGTGPNGITISPDNKTLYVANYNSHDIAVIDIASRLITYKIDVGSEAYCLAVSPDGARLYVSNINANQITVINTLTRSIFTTVDVGEHPAGITTSSDGSKVYVVNAGSPFISVIDAATNTATQQIPVPVSGGHMVILSDNECPGSPVQFSITVNPSATPVTPSDVTIPNSFSPNGDGSNDLWSIPGLSAYPQNTVEVFNRYGQLLFRSTGYSNPWDGTFNGQHVPPATYYYIVNLRNGKKALSGSVTIVR